MPQPLRAPFLNSIGARWVVGQDPKSYTGHHMMQTHDVRVLKA